MHVVGIVSAIVVGLIIGGLARLVLPGKQDIPLWLTAVIGAVGAVIGTFFAQLLGVASTPGIDWIELALQVGIAAVGVSFVTEGRSRRKIGRR